MALLRVVLHPDPRLARVCAPVPQVDDALRRLAADMLDTMYAAPGRGLAGPQVGAMVRLVVMDAGWKEGAPEPLVLVNPEVLAASDELATREEGCLSIPGRPMRVTRPAEVTVRWTTLGGTREERRFSGFAAACVQHEIDHLDGILILDRGVPPEAAPEAGPQAPGIAG